MDDQAGQSAHVLPGTRAKMVAQELRRMIQTGELPPGAHLRQAEFARRFGVSTTPVREAFTALEREGRVRQDAHRGVVVFEPELLDLTENYEIRGVLEPLAAGLAAASITADDLSALDTLLEHMRTEQDMLRYQGLNRRFHARMYAACGRPRLEAIIGSLRDASESYLRISATQPGAPEYQQAVQEEHASIAAALRAGDPKRVRRLMTDHLQHNRDQLAELFSREPPTST